MASIEDESIDNPLGDDDTCHVTIAEDPISTGSSCAQPCDPGHERLIEKKTASNGLQHSRASNPPNYLWFAVIVS